MCRTRLSGSIPVENSDHEGSILSSVFVPPDGAAVLNGYLIPGANYIKALIDQLRDEISKNPDLQKRYQENPREVLGERGIVKDLQTEIMEEQGLDVAEALGWCISTGSCCCETL
jgi:hypothetical protein